MLCEDDYGNKYMLKAVSSNVGCWKSEEVLRLVTFPLSLSLLLLLTVYHPNNKLAYNNNNNNALFTLTTKRNIYMASDKLQ